MGQDHVTVGTGGIGTRFISKEYPVTEGLTLGTTKLEGKSPRLVPEENIVLTDDNVGLNNGW